MQVYFEEKDGRLDILGRVWPVCCLGGIFLFERFYEYLKEENSDDDAKERREILEVCFETQTMHKVPIFNFRINNKLRRNVSMSLSLGLGKKRVLCCPNVSVPKGKA